MSVTQSVSLSMPLFVSPDDVILRMQLNADLDGVVDVVSNAIMGAELHVQQLLDGNFVRQSQDCMFQLDSDAFSGIQPGGMFRVELPSGFVRRDTPIVITCSDDNDNYEGVGNWEGWGFRFNDSGQVDPFGNFSPVDMSQVKIDYNRGYVLLSARQYRDRFLRIQCDTGFEPGTNLVPVTGIPDYDPTSNYKINDIAVYNGVVWLCTEGVTGISGTVNPNGPPNLQHWSIATLAMEQLPPVLYEAIMTLVPTLFDSSQTTNRNQQAESQYKKAADHASLLLRGYERLVGFSFRPLWR